MPLVEHNIIFVGSSGVGKSSVLLRAAKNEFSSKFHPTSGVDMFRIVVNNEIFKCWDFAGQEMYASTDFGKILTDSADAFVLMFDVTNNLSFKALKRWQKQDVPVLIVGNKSELKTHRKITGIDWISTSAKSGNGISVVFEILSRILK
jgi:small GTP-binding protein